MDERIYSVAAGALGISVEDAKSHSKKVPEADAIYVWDPARGGLSAFVSSDGTKLVAVSSVNYEDHLRTFLEGRRNKEPKVGDDNVRCFRADVEDIRYHGI